jgi:ABC-type Fe3+-hydroxamate transport system substrate-binding protein
MLYCLFISLALQFVHAITFPAGITNCGVQNWITSTPQRAVTLNQGATEMLLALNLSRK